MVHVLAVLGAVRANVTSTERGVCDAPRANRTAYNVWRKAGGQTWGGSVRARAGERGESGGIVGGAGGGDGSQGGGLDEQIRAARGREAADDRDGRRGEGTGADVGRKKGGSKTVLRYAWAETFRVYTANVGGLHMIGRSEGAAAGGGIGGALSRSYAAGSKWDRVMELSKQTNKDGTLSTSTSGQWGWWGG